MQESKYIWRNGEFIPWADATTHLLTHSLHYGAAAFEGIRAYETERGTAIFRLEDHLRRLFYSASVINMQIPYSIEELANATKELIKKNELKACYIRPLVYYGYGKMGVSPIGAPLEIAIACWSWDKYIPHKHVDMKTNKYVRIPRNASVADAKLIGNYLNSILGILEIKGTDYHETLFLDNDGYIAEGPAENIFFIKNNILYTPKLGAILAGITRDTVLEIAQKFGIKTCEINIKLQDAYYADEVFLTGTAIEIMPVRSIDNKTIKDGEIGPITKKIQKYYLDLVYGKIKEWPNYLSWV